MAGKQKEKDGSNVGRLLMDLGEDGSEDGTSTPTGKEASTIPPTAADKEGDRIPPPPSEREADTILPAPT